MTAGALGAGTGLLAGAGLVLAGTWLAARRSPTLEDRVGPYLGDGGRLARLQRKGPFERLMRPALVRACGRDRLRGAAGGLLAGLVAAVALTATSSGSGAAETLPLILFVALAGGLIPDWRSRRAAAARRSRLLAELPTVAELLALAVAAGEDAAAALDRVTRISRGELAGELGKAVAEARAGVPLTVALDRLAQRTPVPALARFVDGVVVAIERGTPLADVLHAQAADAREAGRRTLLEAGARKELGMLVPVVFVVLPTCVVFALFPALQGLSLVAP